MRSSAGPRRSPVRAARALLFDRAPRLIDWRNSCAASSLPPESSRASTACVWARPGRCSSWLAANRSAAGTIACAFGQQREIGRQQPPQRRQRPSACIGDDVAIQRQCRVALDHRGRKSLPAGPGRCRARASRDRSPPARQSHRRAILRRGSCRRPLGRFGEFAQHLRPQPCDRHHPPAAHLAKGRFGRLQQTGRLGSSPAGAAR
jgi:hypothetical protein